MITEDYVSFDTAKLLKEKGFDEDIDLWYDENGEMFSRHKYDISSDWRVKAQQKVYLCPTLQMAMKWLRGKKCCPIEILWHFDSDNQIDVWYFKHHVELRELPVIKYYDTYEGACEAGIKYCLENLI